MAKNRKRDEDDDDDLDRPRRKKKKGDGGNGVIFGLIAGGTLVVLAAVVAIVIVTRDKKPDTPATESANTDTKGKSPTPPNTGPTPPTGGQPTGLPGPKKPAPEPTGGAVLNEANLRKVKQNMTRAQFEAIFGQPMKANPTVQDRATYLLGEPTWTNAVEQSGPLRGYTHVLYAEGDVGMEANFRVDASGNETINGAHMTIRGGRASQGGTHVMLGYFNIDGKVTRKVIPYGPNGALPP